MAKPDTFQTARNIIQHVTGEDLSRDGHQIFKLSRGKDPNAVALGRKGGLVGGPARAVSTTPEERKEWGKLGAEKRWAKK